MTAAERLEAQYEIFCATYDLPPAEQVRVVQQLAPNRSIAIAVLKQLQCESLPWPDGLPSVDDRTDVGGASRPRLEIPTDIAGYQDLALVGSGATSEVYKATREKLGNRVALKFYLELYGTDEATLDAARREGRTIAQLSHPGIAAVQDLEHIVLDATDERTEILVPFLVMEFVEGETLASIFQRKAWDEDIALVHAIRIGKALVYAHSAGVVHRDLKPENIMLDEHDQTKVLDFGIAQRWRPGLSSVEESRDDPANPSIPDAQSLRPRSATSRGAVVGTFRYMSPEQLRGQEVSAKTDVWAFGCVLYESLVGPVDGGRSYAHANGPLEAGSPLSKLPDRYRAEFAALLGDCWEELPSRRPRMADVVARLESIAAARDDVSVVGSKSGRSSVVVIIVTAFAVLGMIAIATLFLLSPYDAQWQGNQLHLINRFPFWNPEVKGFSRPFPWVVNSQPQAVDTVVPPRPFGLFRQVITVAGNEDKDHSLLLLFDWRGKLRERRVSTQPFADSDGVPSDVQWHALHRIELNDGNTAYFVPSRSVDGPFTLMQVMTYESGGLVPRHAVHAHAHIEFFSRMDIDGDGTDEMLGFGFHDSVPQVGMDTKPGGRSVMICMNVEEMARQTAPRSLAEVDEAIETFGAVGGVQLGISFDVDEFTNQKTSKALSARWDGPGVLRVSCHGYDAARAVEYRIEMNGLRPVACKGAVMPDSYRELAEQSGFSASGIEEELVRLASSVGVLGDTGWTLLPYDP